MRTRYQAVYAALGRLFHAIARCDRRVTPSEHNTLKELIRKRWLALEDSRDEHGTDAAYYIGFAFDTAAEGHAGVEEDFVAFKDALRDHPSLFTEELRTLAWETAHEIAQAVGGENRAEEDMLARLGQVLHGRTMTA